MKSAGLFDEFPPPAIGPYTGAPLTRPLVTPEAEAYGLSSPREPATSDEAAIEHARSGRLSNNVRIVVKLVRRHPGSTAVELHCAQIDPGDNLTRTEMSRRLPDAEKRGLIRKGPARKCTLPPFHSMVTWEPVKEPK